MKEKFKQKLQAKQEQVVRRSKFLIRHPFLIPVMVFVVLFFAGMFFFVSLGASTEGAADANIVNVFTENEEQIVTTRADTVGELLERLGVELGEFDIVEPSRDFPILEDNTHVNIYRARPVQVVDGDRTLISVTAQRAPRLVAADAGIDLLPEDEATFERLEASTLETVSEQLVIERSVEVQLNLYGVIKQFRTVADTVEELLEDEGVVPGENETVQPDVLTPITPSLLVSLNRPGVKTDAVREPIPFETERRDDGNLAAGKTRVERDGENGIRAVIYEIEEQDGVEVSRKAIQEVVLKQPVNEVILRGTKIVAPYFDPRASVSADKVALMSAAGIAASDYAYADYIISHESGWRPGAHNTYSGAYGLCQSLPASKMASAGPDYLTNPITQLRWCSGYASRYGGWAGAYSAWLAQGWW